MPVATNERGDLMIKPTLFLFYMACIPAANLLVTHVGLIPVGFGLMAPAGVLVVGLAFTVRDLLQRVAGPWWALAAIAVGTALSFAVGDPAIALASAAAFGLSELVDMGIFTSLRSRPLIAVGVSNAVALVVDSVVFLGLAFGSLAYLPGQIVGKLLMTVLALVVLVPLRTRLRAA